MEQQDQNAVDIQAVEYALCHDGNFNQVYINMELLLSCENLPYINGMKPNTIGIMYLDQNMLGVANPGAAQKGQAPPIPQTQETSKLEGFSPSKPLKKDKKQMEPIWVEKWRSEIRFGEDNPIYLDSYIFKSVRYDLLKI